MENKKPKVILLVAGEGKRLRPYTLDRPKCMVEIDGARLIDRQLSVLQSEGLDNIVMIGGYKSYMLEEYDIKLKINPRYNETNMVWTLFSAKEELTGDVIVSYGDIVYSKKILRKLLKSSADISVVIDMKWEAYWRQRSDNLMDDAETLKIRPDGTIGEIGRKPNSIHEIEGQYIGLMKFSSLGVEHIKKVFSMMKENGEMVEECYMTDLLQRAINYGVKIMPVFTYDKWIEIDTVDDLLSDFTANRLKSI